MNPLWGALTLACRGRAAYALHTLGALALRALSAIALAPGSSSELATDLWTRTRPRRSRLEAAPARPPARAPTGARPSPTAASGSTFIGGGGRGWRGGGGGGGGAGRRGADGLDGSEDIRVATGGRELRGGRLRGHLVDVKRVQKARNNSLDHGRDHSRWEGELLARLFPEKRVYLPCRGTMPDDPRRPIDNGVFRDLYVVIGDPPGETAAGRVRTFIKPYANWIGLAASSWRSGGVLSLTDRRVGCRKRPRAEKRPACRRDPGVPANDEGR